MYDKILVPTDGSTGMQPVIDHAATLADVHNGSLHALYSVNTASLTDLGLESSWENISQALKQEGETAIAGLEAQVSDVPVETAIREGSPATEIVEYAEQEDCDVIVMGTHGRSGFDRILLGSVAERVVRSSSVPVLTIRVDESPSE